MFCGNGEYVSPTQPFAAGMLISNVADLVKWDAALADGTASVEAASRRLTDSLDFMQQVVVDVAGPGNALGLVPGQGEAGTAAQGAWRA